ncbi:MAG TPA: GAF domain-containing protein [Acidimicrobiales bacterium]|nr:GAF domain-containing protein [Acidimicrobiales bacterium]
MSHSSLSAERVEKRAAERYERLLEVQQLMGRVAREIGPALELERVLHIVLNGMRSLLDFDGGSISLIDDRGLYVAAADPDVSEEVKALRLPIGQGLSGRAVQSGQTQYSPDIRTDERVLTHVRELGSNVRMVSYLVVPLIVFGEAIGAIQVNASGVDAFDRDDQVLLEGLATQVAGAIESARRFEKVAELEVLKSDFIQRVSHELRTPITIMSGFVTTLLTHHDALDPAARRTMLERIEVATGRLSGLIDELLMLSKLEAGVVAANREPVDLTVALEQVRRESADPDAVTVTCVPGVRVDTDPSLLVRALGFLVDNSLKYAGHAELHGGPKRIEVVDHGPGIRPDARTKVFERFTRATDQTTLPGMGIGLPMARTLLAAIGADLSLEETEGGGTRFVVAFWD